jgi:hypothetical protein
MAKLRTVLTAVASGLTTFVVTGYAAFAALVHFTGTDRVDTGGTPAVVLGVFWCFGGV